MANPKYIQDVGAKTAGYLYIDNTTNIPYKCLTNNSDTDLTTHVTYWENLTNEKIATDLKLVNEKIKDSGWISPTLLNGWVNYGLGHATAQYKKIGNQVFLRGMISGGTSGLVFILPSGFRPLEIENIGIANSSTNTSDRINVSYNGNVTLSNYSGVAWTSLSTASFFVD